MPVLPLVGSRIVEPGCRDPSFSAASIIAMAARSLMDPVGLWSSSLAHSRTSGVGDRFGSPTSGVPPRESTSEANRAMGSAAGDGREDGDRVAVLDLGVERTGEPDVLVVDVDVHEAVQLALVGDEAVLQAGVLAVEVVDERRMVGIRTSMAMACGSPRYVGMSGLAGSQRWCVCSGQRPPAARDSGRRR